MKPFFLISGEPLHRTKQLFVDQLAKYMTRKNVDLLNSGGLVAGHADTMIDQVTQSSAVVASQSDGDEPLLMRD
jgi:hypothetical protein